MRCSRRAVGSCPELRPLVTGAGGASLHAEPGEGVAVDDAKVFVERAERQDTTVDLFVREVSDVPSFILPPLSGRRRPCVRLRTVELIWEGCRIER